MYQMAKVLEKIPNYDIEKFVQALRYHISELSFFYNHMVPQEHEKSNINKAEEGQIALFELARSFEFYETHYCYILKELKEKYIVIPVTPVKKDTEEIDAGSEMDIFVKEFKDNDKLRLHINELRIIDIQRLDKEKATFNVVNSRQEILKKVISLLCN